MHNDFQKVPLIGGLSPAAWLHSTVFWNLVVPQAEKEQGDAEREAFTMKRAVVVAKRVARKNRSMRSRFSDTTLCNLALEAILLKLAYLDERARNWDNAAFRVADNFLKNQFTRDFPKEAVDKPEKRTDEKGDERPITDLYGVSGSKFGKPASPNEWSQSKSEEIMDAVADWLEERRAKLPDALEQLSEIQRRIIHLLFYTGSDADLTCPEIAEMVGLPRSTVYFHLDKALRKLRKFLGTVEAAA